MIFLQFGPETPSMDLFLQLLPPFSKLMIPGQYSALAGFVLAAILPLPAAINNIVNQRI